MDHTPKKVNEVNTSSLKYQISYLTSLVRQMVVNNVQAIKVCGICCWLYYGYVPNFTRRSVNLQANTIRGSLGQTIKNDPYSNSYNPSWQDHHNLSYGNQAAQNRYKPPFQSSQQATQPLNISLEEIVKVLASNKQQFQHETRKNIQNMEK